MASIAATTLVGAAANGILQSGVYAFGVQGTWSTTTVAVQASMDGGTTWTTVKDINGNAVSFTANGNTSFYASNVMLYQIAVTLGSGSGLNYQLGQALARK